MSQTVYTIIAYRESMFMDYDAFFESSHSVQTFTDVKLAAAAWIHFQRQEEAQKGQYGYVPLELTLLVNGLVEAGDMAYGFHVEVNNQVEAYYHAERQLQQVQLMINSDDYKHLSPRAMLDHIVKIANK